MSINKILKNFKKALFILLLSCYIISCSKNNNITSDVSLPNTTSSTPNILLIIADDFGLDAAPNYDTGLVKPNMPNLLKMANNGITFDNFWTSPLCAPTRAAILTGKYGIKTGVLNATTHATIKTNEKTLQTYLDEQLGKVYNHSIIGKWHLSNNDANRPTNMGIDFYSGMLSGTAKSYYDWNWVENGVTTKSNEYITTKITNLAIDWINQQNKNWFCWLAYTAPHTPFHLPPTEMHSQGNLPTDQASIDANPLPYYMAMVESMDYEIGRLLNNIPPNELENTIIIFMGDNGTPSKVAQTPYTRTKSKGSLYQGGIAAPLIISGKSITRKGERDSQLIYATDLFSTIAQIAGVSATEYQNSKSFYSLLTQENTENKSYNYSEVLNTDLSKSGYVIRNNSYKLFVLDNGTEMFFDLINDPYETKNLINILSDKEKTAYNNLKSVALTERN